MFLIEQNIELLSALGITCGTIHIEGLERFSIIDVETAEAVLNRAVEEMLVEPRHTDAIMEQVRAAGVAPNFKAVFELVAQVAIPEDFDPLFKFELHTGCGFPLAHGNIVDLDNVRQSEPMTTVLVGLDFLINWVGQIHNRLNVLDGVYLVKEMIAANLPVNETDLKAQYMKLPLEDRLEYEEISQLFFLGTFAVDVRLPTSSSQPPQTK